MNSATRCALERAQQILEAHRDLHDRTARTLLQKETLDQEDIEALRREIAPHEVGERVRVPASVAASG